MRVLAMVVLLVTALPMLADGPGGSPEKIKAELMKIEEEVIHANETCDRAAFERIEAAEFLFTSSSGSVTTKEEDLAGMKDCRPKQLHAEISEVRLQPLGKTAVFNAKLTETLTKKDGTPVVVSFRFTDVFVWREGRWQMTTGQSSRIPEPSPAK